LAIVERREHGRIRIWFPVQVDAEDVGQQIGISYDVSRGGILISAAQRMEVGKEITVTLRLLPIDAPVEKVVRGRIVRMGRNDDDPDGIWPFRMAVEFAEPIPELEGYLEVEPASRGA
jgi:hypothetical protein